MNARDFWADFAFDYILEERDLAADLIAIEGYKLAALNLVLPPEWSGQLNRMNRVRAVHGTTAIEGNPLSPAEVERQIDLVEQSDFPAAAGELSREQLQIRNAAQAQEWVRERFAPGTAPATLTDLRTMHRMVTQGSDEGHNRPGRFRAYPVTVGSPELGGIHSGAPYETLDDLMAGFIRFIHSRRFRENPPVVKGLLAHFFLVTIHPFGDGNGRVSRLLEAGILFQSEYNVHGFYGLSNYFYRNAAEYMRRLQESRRSQPFDLLPFIGFGVKGFAAELGGINNFVKNKFNRTLYRQMMEAGRRSRWSARRRTLNDREYGLLTFLLAETEPGDPFSEAASRPLRLSALLESQYVRGTYRQVSQRTFVRELHRLAAAGFIRFMPGVRSGDAVLELDFGAIAKYPAGGIG